MWRGSFVGHLGFPGGPDTLQIDMEARNCRGQRSDKRPLSTSILICRSVVGTGFWEMSWYLEILVVHGR